jgi:hypothetical protein
MSYASPEQTKYPDYCMFSDCRETAGYIAHFHWLDDTQQSAAITVCAAHADALIEEHNAHLSITLDSLEPLLDPLDEGL